MTPLASEVPHGFTDIAIVGFGSRGLIVLAQLLRAAFAEPSKHIKVLILDPDCTAEGIHCLNQPDYLLLNTIAHEICVFEPSCKWPTGEKYLTFYEWYCSQAKSEKSDHFFEATDFIPRRYLGQYLNYLYNFALRNKPENVSIEVVQSCATNISSARHFRIETDNQKVYHTVCVVITIGHATPQSNGSSSGERVVACPYPLPEKTINIGAEQTVALSGLGLAAIDCICSLTYGRGGQFRTAGNGELVYIASGNEPRIILYSRNGLPYASRPAWTLNREPHDAIFFTREKIAELKAEKGKEGIDFEVDLLPLIKADMKAAYYISHSKFANNGNSTHETVEQLTKSSKNGTASCTFKDLAYEFGDLDLRYILATEIIDFNCNEDYTQWFVQFLKDDIVQSERGIKNSHVKAAIEVWRDLRDNIRYAVNYDSLSKQSQAIFYSKFAPLSNRLVGGPQKERSSELAALIQSGIVDLFVAPKIDWNEKEKNLK